MFVDSKPQGFYIYINGRNTGQLTPDTINWLPLKNYNVTLKQNLWRDTTFVLHSDTAEVPDMFIDQLANPKMYGSIKFRSNPNNSNIFLNDTLLNQKTPFIKTRLIPGYYKVKFTKPEHRHVEQTVTVRSNDTTEIYGALQDTSLWVDYNTRNSEIKFDNLKFVAVDKNDTKWIATYGNGVIKLDNNGYEYYNPSNSLLPTRFINSIVVAPDNKIWICTQEGAVTIKDDFWELYDKYNSDLPVNAVNTVEFEDDGTVWLGTVNGLVKIQNSRWRTFRIVREIDSLTAPFPTSVTGIAIRDKDDIWVGTSAYSLFQFNQFSTDTNYYGDTVRFKEYTDFKHGFPSFKIIDAERDFKGNIWFIHGYDRSVFPDIFPEGRLGGISMVENGDTTFRMDRFTKPESELEGIFIDHSNKKWVCSKVGLYLVEVFGRKKLFDYTSSKLPFAHLTSTAQESNGLMWCTSNGGGLIKFKFYK